MYANMFKKQSIDGLVLMNLDDDSLLDLGVFTQLHRNKILLHVAQFRAQNKEELREIEFEMSRMSGEGDDGRGEYEEEALKQLNEAMGRDARGTEPDGQRTRGSMSNARLAVSPGSRSNRSSRGAEKSKNEYNNLLNKRPSEDRKEVTRQSRSVSRDDTGRDDEDVTEERSPVMSPSISVKSISSIGSDHMVLGMRSPHGHVMYDDDDITSGKQRSLVTEANDDPDDVKRYNNMLSEIWKFL